MRNQDGKRTLQADVHLKLRLLQWKILNNIYPPSILLNKIGISNSKNYAFAIKQIILNIFFFFFFFWRKTISTIWKYVEEKVYRKFEIKLKLIVNDVLFGYKVNTFQWSGLLII